MKTKHALHYFLLVLALTGVMRAEEKPEILRAPRTAEGWHGQYGKILHFVVTGAAGKNLWGTDVYTTFSEIAPVTVHAGVLKIGETAVIKVTLVKQTEATPSTRNGITSQHWRYENELEPDCYKVERTNLPVPDLSTPTPTPPPAGAAPDLKAIKAEAGKTLSFKIRGSLQGSLSLYGTDVYTIESDIAAAAVHAGILKDGQEGMVKVTIMAPQTGFKGTTQNGATSQSWNSSWACYKIEKAK